MPAPFTAAHRGGSGPPLLCLHGFGDTWRTWELVLPALERRHEVLAVTLAGHAGGPRLPREVTVATLADAVEAALDALGLGTVHVVGNSLGGYVALQLAERGRARSVVALAPAGGWPAGDPRLRALLEQQQAVHAATVAAAGRADAIVATPAGRRRASAELTVAWEHLPAELLAHQLVGFAACDAGPLLECAVREGHPLDAARITCPVRVVWGRCDRLLPWPAAADRLRTAILPQADWVELEDVGHCPQLDVPAVTADLVLGWTAPPGS